MAKGDYFVSGPLRITEYTILPSPRIMLRHAEIGQRVHYTVDIVGVCEGWGLLDPTKTYTIRLIEDGPCSS